MKIHFRHRKDCGFQVYICGVFKKQFKFSDIPSKVTCGRCLIHMKKEKIMHIKKEKYAKVTLIKTRRILGRSGLALDKQKELLQQMFPQEKNKGVTKLKRIVIHRILKALNQDGKCGIQVTDSGKIYIVKGIHCKFSNFNFQRPEILKKALENQNKNTTGVSNA